MATIRRAESGSCILGGLGRNKDNCWWVEATWKYPGLKGEIEKFWRSILDDCQLVQSRGFGIPCKLLSTYHCLEGMKHSWSFLLVDRNIVTNYWSCSWQQKTAGVQLDFIPFNASYSKSEPIQQQNSGKRNTWMLYYFQFKDISYEIIFSSGKLGVDIISNCT